VDELQDKAAAPSARLPRQGGQRLARDAQGRL